MLVAPFLEIPAYTITGCFARAFARGVSPTFLYKYVQWFSSWIIDLSVQMMSSNVLYSLLRVHEILLSLFCVRIIWQYLLPWNVQSRILQAWIMVLVETLQPAVFSIFASWVAVVLSSACTCASMISNTLGVSLKRPPLPGSRDSVLRALYFETVVQMVFLVFFESFCC